MGVTINDTILLDNGLSTNTGYGSFFRSNIVIEKEATIGDPMDVNNNQYTETGNIIITSNGHIWSSKDYRDTNKSIIRVDNVQTIVPISTLISSNIYSLLYTEWKKKYTNIVDAL